MCHFKQVCEHDIMISQCRCPSTSKARQVIRPCPFGEKHKGYGVVHPARVEDVLWLNPPPATATAPPEQVSSAAAYLEGLKQRPGDQPLPVINDAPDIQSQVIADIEERRQVGISRYGTALQPHNGRDALRDAYEEAIDLAMYLKQAILERDSAKARRRQELHDEKDEEFLG